MSTEGNNKYQLFTKHVLDTWTKEGVDYVKVEELAIVNGVTLFELIPDSELLDGGEVDILYTLDSIDVQEMLLPSKDVRFVVHDIYLDDINEG